MIWVVIIALAIGSYLLRFSFLGLIGDREMPPWLLRHLRYTAVAILPALVAPIVVWPNGLGAAPDPKHIAAAAATLIAGYVTRNTFAAIAAGAIALFTLIYWL